MSEKKTAQAYILEIKIEPLNSINKFEKILPKYDQFTSIDKAFIVITSKHENLKL